MEKYTQIKKIGAGSFGAAILYRRNDNGSKVVIKHIDIRDLGEEERKAAKREATILNALRHPCIIAHYESFIDAEGYLCICTEFAEKGDVGVKISELTAARQHMTEPVILDWFVQLSLALLYMHKKKILHRDLKPQNVFISSDNILKLGDFGIARVLRNTMEYARTVVGTPYYLAPELCEEKPYNWKSDVWSTGCILYELCTLKHAFDASNITSLVRKILKGTYDEIPASQYSPELRGLVYAMLQQQPAARPAFLTILQQPFLQPYIHSFAKRCAVMKIDVPYIDQLIQINVPPVMSTSQQQQQQQQQRGSSNSGNSVATSAGAASGAGAGGGVPGGQLRPSSASRGYVPEEGGPVRQIVLTKPAAAAAAAAGRGANNGSPYTSPSSSPSAPPASSSSSHHSTPSSSPASYSSSSASSVASKGTPNVDVAAAAAAGRLGIAAQRPTPGSAGGASTAVVVNNGILGRASGNIAAGAPKVQSTQDPTIHNNNNNDAKGMPPSSSRVNLNASPAPDANNNNNKQNAPRASSAANFAYVPSPPPSSKSPSSFPASAITPSAITSTSAITAAPSRPFLYDGKAYALPVGAVRSPFPTPNAASSSTANNSSNAGAGGAYIIPKSTPPNSSNAPVSGGGGGGGALTPSAAGMGKESSGSQQQYRSSTNNDEKVTPTSRAAYLEDRRSSRTDEDRTGGGEAKSTPTSSSSSSSTAAYSSQQQQQQQPEQQQRYLRPSVLADPLFQAPVLKAPSALVKNNNSNRPASRTSRGGGGGGSTRDSVDSEGSITAEDLLEEADILLPHGLPLNAYKVNGNVPELLSAASGAGRGGEDIANGAGAITSNNNPQHQKMRIIAAVLPPDGGITGANLGVNDGGMENDAVNSESIKPQLSFTFVPAHLTRRKVKKGVVSTEPSQKQIPSSSSSSSSAENEHDKFTLNGATLYLPSSSNRDPLTYRVECLRVFLDSVLGEKEFLRLYTSLTEARAVDASVDLAKTVRKALGKDHKGLLPLVFQLIYNEDKAFG